MKKKFLEIIQYFASAKKNTTFTQFDVIDFMGIFISPEKPGLFLCFVKE